ncbi:unnamed protein product [Notodromas monacha]|uniref:Glycolipid transfer protein domain-containing protein n=1 Tax=Notodromas monacha TaxID=399045 RepID=A0A7R9BGC9_9CRUS|nr:unnamed protein product [Notodromas monacha]CAG0914955.1 unnamed protein product [Notodromas monacha]
MSPTDVFAVIKCKFPSAGEEIATEKFLAAAKEVPDIIGALGTVLMPVKMDIVNNIQKLSGKLSEEPEKYKLLFDMVREEGFDASAPGTISLLWLKRGLEMFRGALCTLLEAHKSKNPSNSLVEQFRGVYSKCLSQYHGWALQKLFYIGLAALPYRTSMVESLRDAHRKDGEEPESDETFYKNLEAFIDNLSGCLDPIIAFFDDHGLNSRDRV